MEMTSTADNYNNDNQSEIPLKLTKMVEDSKIIQKFVIDHKTFLIAKSTFANMALTDSMSTSS